jgi:PAS domain S-box-containing protein
MTPSISRRLTVSLMSAVLIVSVFAITVIDHIVSRTAEENLERKADEIITYAAGILEVPLWEVSTRHINELGRIISKDEAVATLVVYNDSGTAICSISKESTGDVINRSRKIVHRRDDREVQVGTVDVSLSKASYKDRTRQLLYSSILIILVILVSIVVVTGFLIRIFLRKPLIRLNEIVTHYASGIYDIADSSIPYIEFQPFGVVLKGMADKITTQINEVRDAEAKYRGIFENAVEGMFQTTPGGKPVSVNPSLASMLGYESPGVLIDSISNIAKELYADLSRRDELLHQLSENDTVSDFEARLRRKDGSLLWASLNVRAVKDSDGKIIRLEGFMSDITGRKRAEEALRKAQEELVRKEKLAILGRLAGIVGHEIRNPLGVMNNAIYFLKTVMTDADDRVKEYLDIIQHEIGSSQRIITDLLDFARTKTPRARLVVAGGLVTESLDKCAIPENIDVQTELSDALPQVYADPFQMVQVLQNLITNGIQAMPEGGGLRIGATWLPEPGFVEITVTDTGEGIPPENMEKLFQPLFTTKARGIGLGLVACKNLVEANGGEISVESSFGEGTTFALKLPIAEEK